MEELEQKVSKKRDYILPASILIAALLISGSLIYNAGTRGQGPITGAIGDAVGFSENSPSPLNIKPVSETDHILGSLNAPFKIVEFSDLECPFCKRFHQTMKDIRIAYGDTVSWIYRHYPLQELHTKALKEAEATECANELGGNDAFWKYTDRLFEITPSNDGLDLAELPKIATAIGLDKNKFEACLASGKYVDYIAEDRKDAENSGAQGTPYSVIITKDNKKYVINGALPYEQVKAMLDSLISS